MDALDARRLSKRFGDTCAVDGVSIALAPGEVRGLLGPNGAGKTTLLRMLLGLVRADDGEIEIFGARGRWAQEPLPPQVAGLVEEPAFYPYLSAEANLEVFAALDDAESGKIRELLERVELGGDAGRRVAGFSTGMRQRLGLACALLRSPQLLILDEPTAGLDPAGMRLVEHLVGELSADGVAVLLSSHHIDEVERICDTFTVLRAGRVVWEGTRAQMHAQATAPARLMETGDNALALSIAAEIDGLRCEATLDGPLVVEAGQSALDAFVLALGRADVAVRRLEQSMSALEAMFFALTGDGAAANEETQRAVGL